MHACVQDWSVEDANSADIALGRFGREPAAASSGAAVDVDVLSAATAVQRWELDHSHEKGARQGRRKDAAGNAAEETPLVRPILPAGGLFRPHMMQCFWLQLLNASMDVEGVLQIVEKILQDKNAGLEASQSVTGPLK